MLYENIFLSGRNREYLALDICGDVKVIFEGNNSLECVESSLINGEKVQLVGFGTFDVKRKGPRPGRNPKKPEIEITIPAANVPYFKPGKYLKESLNSSEAE